MWHFPFILKLTIRIHGPLDTSDKVWMRITKTDKLKTFQKSHFRFLLVTKTYGRAALTIVGSFRSAQLQNRIEMNIYFLYPPIPRELMEI